MQNSNMTDVWANSMACHPRAMYHIAGCCHLMNSLSQFQSHIPHATLQDIRIPSAVLKIVFRHIYFFFVFNAVQALTSGGFRIISDTLVLFSHVTVDKISLFHYYFIVLFSNSSCYLYRIVLIFSRVSTLKRDIDIAIPFVCPSVRCHSFCTTVLYIFVKF